MSTNVDYQFHHQHLVVEDVASTVASYVDILDARKLQQIEYQGVDIVVLELGGIKLIVSGQLYEGIGDHIALAVGDFDAAIEQLRDRGAAFVFGPTDAGGVKFAFLELVAGRLLEIVKFADEG